MVLKGLNMKWNYNHLQPDVVNTADLIYFAQCKINTDRAMGKFSKQQTDIFSYFS